MMIKSLNDVPANTVPGCEGVTKRIVLGPGDGSHEIVLRHFSLAPGASTPHHAHGFPHLVKVESGNGTITDADGCERPLSEGDYAFVRDNEVHHFTNAGTAPFAFICIVPRRGEA